MKKSQLNPIELINDHIRAIQQRLLSSSDPKERELFQKRLRNMESVRQFILANLSCYPPETTA